MNGRNSPKWKTGDEEQVDRISCSLGKIKLILEEDTALEVDTISMKHLKIILKGLEIENPQDVIRKLDPFRQGYIKFSALSELLKMRRRQISEAELRRAFDLMDEDKKGFLTIADLKRMNKDLDEKMSQEELQEMLDDADIDGLGIVTEEHFIAFMKNAQEDAINCNCAQK